MDIPSNLGQREEPTDTESETEPDTFVPEGFKIVLASVVVTTVLLLAVALVVVCILVLHRKLNKYYNKLDKRLMLNSDDII
jgi:hypothetical protein